MVPQAPRGAAHGRGGNDRLSLLLPRGLSQPFLSPSHCPLLREIYRRTQWLLIRLEWEWHKKTQADPSLQALTDCSYVYYDGGTPITVSAGGVQTKPLLHVETEEAPRESPSPPEGLSPNSAAKWMKEVDV